MKEKSRRKTLSAVVSYFIACFFVVLLCSNGEANALTVQQRRLSMMKKWKAETEVSPEVVKKFGIDRCFSSQQIDDALFRRIYQKSFKANCTVPRESLRYIKVIHYTLAGKIHLGEIICNVAIAKDLLEIFRALYDARYPIERIRLIDDYDADDERSMKDNNSSCFNFRFIGGTTKLSNHASGYAIDINTLYNPYVKVRANGSLLVSPSCAKPFVDRTRHFNYKIDHDDLCFKLFTEHGFEWGGDWKSLKDYQHFEKKLK